MGLLDKIKNYYGKADSFILERHIELANWANYNFGKSNYELSTYSAFLPNVAISAAVAYGLANNDRQAFLQGIIFLNSAPNFFDMMEKNNDIEELENISLESMVKDPDVQEAKEMSTRARMKYILAGGASAVCYIPALFDNSLIILIPLASGAVYFMFLGSAHYFRSIDHIPKSKGRIPEAVKNAAAALLRKPVANPSGA